MDENRNSNADNFDGNSAFPNSPRQCFTALAYKGLEGQPPLFVFTNDLPNLAGSSAVTLPSTGYSPVTCGNEPQHVSSINSLDTVEPRKLDLQTHNSDPEGRYFPYKLHDGNSVPCGSSPQASNNQFRGHNLPNAAQDSIQLLAEDNVEAASSQTVLNFHIGDDIAQQLPTDIDLEFPEYLIVENSVDAQHQDGRSNYSDFGHLFFDAPVSSWQQGFAAGARTESEVQMEQLVASKSTPHEYVQPSSLNEEDEVLKCWMCLGRSKPELIKQMIQLVGSKSTSQEDVQTSPHSEGVELLRQWSCLGKNNPGLMREMIQNYAAPNVLEQNEGHSDEGISEPGLVSGHEQYPHEQTNQIDSYNQLYTNLQDIQQHEREERDKLCRQHPDSQGMGPLRCPIEGCKASFPIKKKAVWLRHIARCESPDYWRCPNLDCGKWEVRANKLTDHMKNKHGRNSEDVAPYKLQIPPRYWPCGFCNDICDTWKELWAVHVFKHLANYEYKMEDWKEETRDRRARSVSSARSIRQSQSHENHKAHRRRAKGRRRTLAQNAGEDVPSSSAQADGQNQGQERVAHGDAAVHFLLDEFLSHPQQRDIDLYCVSAWVDEAELERASANMSSLHDLDQFLESCSSADSVISDETAKVPHETTAIDSAAPPSAALVTRNRHENVYHDEKYSKKHRGEMVLEEQHQEPISKSMSMKPF